MRNKLFLFCLIVFMSCYDDKDYFIPEIRVYVFYEITDNPRVKKTDADAGVYIYYGKYETDFDGYIYQNDGIFIKENSQTIIPDLMYVTGENGGVFFIPEQTAKNTTIVIESNYYKGKYEITNFSSIMYGAGLYRVFKPE